ncbi:F-actin-capping protein-like protein subunit alpha-1 [Piedraia hortae CBS 480.64]|uniref:F-actin-capping protein subunit alpha n=1 Tax=Piedraia hortae CBS 480.64 TaxID=1314780 RepID=A0A6A7BZ93_9PEZI|nr:F-actin-capping protein-like protein subunit alpha-1 [Piedraia hortae CBS 480.64]
MGSKAIVSSFIEAAPPGELSNVIADIKVLAPNDLSSLTPAYQAYHEAQYTVATLPDNSGTTIISSYNRLSDGRYFDSVAGIAFDFDYTTQKTSNPEPHSIPDSSTVSSLHKSFHTSADEHFPSSTVSIIPGEPTIFLLVANKYSPSNFWNARWRSTYTLSGGTLEGKIVVDVHYYEDGNVRMTSTHTVPPTNTTSGNVARVIAKEEDKFQEELNRAFGNLAEGTFKALRRQLPVTRQRVDWDKIGGYRLGQDIGGSRR